MNRNVLIIDPPIRPVGVDILKQNANVFMAPNGAEDTLISWINENDISAIVTRVEKVTERIIEACPSLRIIAQNGVGLDNIDVAAATRHGLKVLNLPDGNYVSVAEHTLMFLLAMSRDMLVADANVRRGNWLFRETNIPMEVQEKTVLIIGVGRIGGEVARKLAPFNMELLGYDIYLDEAALAAKGTAKIESLEEGLKRADFVTLHVPLTELTHHMISQRQLSLMKPSAYLLNLARGPVVDQQALYQALQSKTIAGAALDVFEQEPPAKDNPLFSCENIIMTPHQAGDTLEAKNRCASKLARSVIQLLDGQEPYNWVNKPE